MRLITPFPALIEILVNLSFENENGGIKNQQMPGLYVSNN
jgi:hypothetical protein